LVKRGTTSHLVEGLSDLRGLHDEVNGLHRNKEVTTFWFETSVNTDNLISEYDTLFLVWTERILETVVLFVGSVVTNEIRIHGFLSTILLALQQIGSSRTLLESVLLGYPLTPSLLYGHGTIIVMTFKRFFKEEK
jgi:hypothetical protein